MLSTKEAAKQLNVQSQTVRNYIREGLGKNKEKLKAIQIMHGRRMEFRIKVFELQYYKEKYLTIKSE